MPTTRRKPPETADKKPPETDESDERPDWWNFETDGPLVVGAFVTAGKGGTKMGGTSPFIVLDLGDEVVRTVWLHHKPLREQFKREVAERGPIKEGERISIRQLGMKESSENEGYSYMNYRTEFLDRAYDQEDIFGVDKTAAEPASTDEVKSPADPDDDIPFQPTG